MFPFWETVIAPIIDAVAPRRIVEIGALRGETTDRMLGHLGSQSELHVIDPEPHFDPSVHERRFAGRYHFHRGLSHDVLPGLPAMDVALIDGDHNWFTVLHELRMLASASEGEGRPLPVLILHDVAWPYGRRDLYYEPARIPEEQRQPYRRAGIKPGRKDLLPEGGFNVGLDNAVEEGGERNGVMTALEDFLAEHDVPVRRVMLPIYFGLAIVAETRVVDANPALAAELDRLESAQGRLDLLELSEDIRLGGALFEHNYTRVLSERFDRAATRYLDVVKAALLDEHYIDNEVRLEYLANLAHGARPDRAALRNPARHLPVRFERLVNSRRAGRSLDGDKNVSYFPFTDMGKTQLERLQDAMAEIVMSEVAGDVAEIGVGRGGGGVLMKAFLDAYEIEDRTVWMVDPFRATLATGADAAPVMEGFGADLGQVQDAFARFDLLDDRVRFAQGELDAALDTVPPGPLALVRLGPEVGDSVAALLERVLPRMAPGGIVVVSGVSKPGAETALGRARDALGSTEPLERIDWHTVRWRVTSPPDPRRASSSAPSLRRVAVPPVRPQTTLDLTVVVVAFDMQREARRTLHSLSRAYQQGIEGLTYEVLVFDNGSPPGRGLTHEHVESYGPEFRLVEMGEDAVPSPTVALNHGIAEAQGDAVALMIDGAHVLTPGVLRLAALAIRAYDPTVVVTQQWYVGPGQQGEAQQSGYDQKVEDRLFGGIHWPDDGYRLFEIGHFIGERDWFDGLVESNCLIVPRKVLDQVGGFDDSFSMPGGGYANLELFERLGSIPGINVVSLLGEASFHQFHDGTTTNVADASARRQRVSSYGEHFQQLRGRPLIGLNTPVNYIGSMATKPARRTRSRREIGLSFDPLRDPVGGPSDGPGPIVPDELKLASIEAIWDRRAWREATWLGRPVRRYPADLFGYQELLFATTPGCVVLLGDDDGLTGRALLAASVCDELDHGRVIAVGTSADRPGHGRITPVVGPAEDRGVIDQVRGLVGGTDAAVFIGLGATLRVVAAFEAYAPLVPVGGYVVIENTVVNGRPVESGFGPGPYEALVDILARHVDFVSDPTFERYTVTFNRGGYLRRMTPA